MGLPSPRPHRCARRPWKRRSSVDELTRLFELRARGDITTEEFDRAKALILTDDRPAPGSGSSVPPRPRTLTAPRRPRSEGSPRPPHGRQTPRGRPGPED
ncbi:SHOCT domain-containing protein [Streptomyces litmocidini]|uniref:SHOCT domain-containing protein n=1 Tax=Streptomyces litmocidini TaxID=67318 RepID=UPI00167EE81A